MVPSPHTAAWALSLSCHKLNMILDKYCCVLCHTENKSVSLYYFFLRSTQWIFFFSSWLFCIISSFLILHLSIPTAVSGQTVSEWIEFVIVWLPACNGFLNCIFYFWINRSFRRKFHLVLQRLTVSLCPKLAETLGCCNMSKSQFVTVLDNNNTVHGRSSSVSSTCTLISVV